MIEEPNPDNNNINSPTLNPHAPTFISYSVPLYGSYQDNHCLMLTADCDEFEAPVEPQFDGGGGSGGEYQEGEEGVVPPPPPGLVEGCYLPPPPLSSAMRYDADPYLPLPDSQHHPTLSLCTSYPSNLSTQSSPEVRGYPIGALSDLSPPPTSISPWKHELQSTCSEDSALHSDSDNLHDQDSLVGRVRKQLEYYFSLENLTTDQYLVSQMDGDQFVPIWTVANFNAVKKLTTDIEVIKEALHSSTEVQIDSTGSKVRPVIKRCTLILRDISHHATAQEIAALFNNSVDCPPCVKCTFAHNNSWFVEFRTEHEALQAYSYFREHPHYFHGDLIKVRIKAKPIQRSSPTDSSTFNNAYPNSVPCYPAMVPMMWMSPSGMMPMDINYQTQGCYSNGTQDYNNEYDHDQRYRVRSAESTTKYPNNNNNNSNNNSRRKSRRNNNNNINNSRTAGIWKHSEFRDRYSRSNCRHKRNDSDDSSTVSSASSYNIPSGKQRDKLTNPQPHDQLPVKNGPSLQPAAKQPSSSNRSQAAAPFHSRQPGNPPQYPKNGKIPPSKFHLGFRQNSNKRFPFKQFAQEKDAKTQTYRQSDKSPDITVQINDIPPEKPPQLDLEPSQFPPLSSNIPESITVNDTWTKKPDKIKDPLPAPAPYPKPPQSAVDPDNTTKDHYSPQPYSGGRGGAAWSGRGGPKYRPAPQFRSDTAPARVTPRRGDGHMTAESAASWRRAPPTSKTNRGMRPMRKSNKGNHERRETDFIPEIRAPPPMETVGRPTYSEIAAKMSGSEAEGTCNGDVATASSSEEECGKKSYSRAISAIPACNHGDHSAQPAHNDSGIGTSPGEEPRPTVEEEEGQWTTPKYRSSRPKNVNLKNVYRLETKLNDLDISEPVFSQQKTETDKKEVVMTTVATEQCRTPSHDITPGSDVTTPRNKLSTSWDDTRQFKTAINWFDDDEDDEEDFLLQNGEQDSPAVAMETECLCEEEDAKFCDAPLESVHLNKSHVSGGEMVQSSHNMQEQYEEGEMSGSDLSPDSSISSTELPEDNMTSPEGMIFPSGALPLSSATKLGVDDESPVIDHDKSSHEGYGEAAVMGRGEEEVKKSHEEGGSGETHGATSGTHHDDSDYDSERDEFYSSYCESPGWE